MARLPKEDQDTLVDLASRHPIEKLIAAIRKLAPMKRPGAPTKHRGNLASVFAFVEYHRWQTNAAGKPLGIDGACKRLRLRLNAHTHNCRTTWGRFRTMYYEAIRISKGDPALAAEMKATLLMHADADVADGFPVLFAMTKSGDLSGLTIDKKSFKSRNACFTEGPFHKLWVCDRAAPGQVSLH